MILKKRAFYQVLRIFLVAEVILISSCGGGGGGGSANTFSVGGNLTGLAAGGSVTLQNNNADDLILTNNGAFSFATALANSASYSIQVLTHPLGQSCNISNNSGVVSNADVTNLTVNCFSNTNTFTVGGSVNGLGIGESVTLQNNGGDDLVILANTVFTFATAIADGAAYNVQITTQPAAKTCVASNNTGTVSNSNITDVVVSCVASQGPGLLDTSFNAAGTTPGIVVDTPPFASIASLGFSSAIDSNGKILVTGHRDFDMALWRYNADGTIDTSFNAGGTSPGLATHGNTTGGDANATNGNAIDWGRDLAIDANGKILVAGESRGPLGIFEMVVWRYNSDGTLDTTFNAAGTPGYVVSVGALGANGSGARAVTVDSNAKILIAGGATSEFHSSFSDLVIWRYNDDGTLDTSFNPTALNGAEAVGLGTPGIRSFNGSPMGEGNESAVTIALDADGKILVAGSQESQVGDALAVWRYNTDGTLDTTFHVAGGAVPGRVSMNIGANFYHFPTSLKIDSNQKIIVTGYASPTAFPGDSLVDMLVLRFNEDGSLDSSFNAGVTPGYVEYDNPAVGDGADTGVSLAIDSDGKYVIAGTSTNIFDDLGLAIWRYNVDGTLDTTFNAGGANPGVVEHQNAAGNPVAGSDDWGESVVIDSLGNIVIVGSSVISSTPFGVPRMIIWRYSP